jgi:type IV pilus assembly protein PilA
MNTKKNLTNKKRGFTLIEILVVIGIIALLATIVIVAVNPAKQFAQARNSQRTSNVNAILNSIGQRFADNKGVFAGAYTIGANTYTCGPIPLVATGINTTMAADIVTATGNLGCLTPTYISSMPTDPGTIVAPATGYTVDVDAAGHVTVCAPNAANETALPSPAAICVTR